MSGIGNARAGRRRAIFVPAADDRVARAVALTLGGALDAAVHAFTALVGARLQADLTRHATTAELIVLAARAVLDVAPVAEPVAA